MTISDFNFDKLPEVQPATTTPGSRLPRFDGDVSEMPNQACWALQNLLARRYISKDAHPDLWAWVIEYRRLLAPRLSELDLRLRIYEDLEVAFVEQAVTDTQGTRARKLLRREPLGTYASILAMQLASLAFRGGTEQLIGRDDIHEMFGGIRHKKDRDETMFRGRVDDAIAKMEKVGILLPSSDDPNSFSISPVIMAIMTGQRIEELSREFERLKGSSGDEPEYEADTTTTTEDDDALSWADDDGDDDVE